ncbi:MAG: hypothetical protein LBC47_03800 [Tannerella sp.]|jgi:hypothetical protein|nr:hypothetical protein [Tannerella sp.]
MLQTISLDSKTILVRADEESDMSALLEYLNRTGKEEKVNALLEFADRHYKCEPGFKFNREECYGR